MTYSADFKPSVTPEELRKLLAYNRRTGVFTWRQGYGRIRAGDEAGTLRTAEQGGGVVVTVNRQVWSGARLAWYYVHGKLPEGRVTFHDGNPYNLAFGNLLEERTRVSTSRAAVYQRERRARRRAQLQQLQDANR